MSEFEQVDADLADILTSELSESSKSDAILLVVGESPALEEQLAVLRRWLTLAASAPPGNPGPVRGTVWTCPLAGDIRLIQEYPDQDMGTCPTHGVRLVVESA